MRYVICNAEGEYLSRLGGSWTAFVKYAWVLDPEQSIVTLRKLHRDGVNCFAISYSKPAGTYEPEDLTAHPEYQHLSAAA